MLTHSENNSVVKVLCKEDENAQWCVLRLANESDVCYGKTREQGKDRLPGDRPVPRYPLTLYKTRGRYLGNPVTASSTNHVIFFPFAIFVLSSNIDDKFFDKYQICCLNLNVTSQVDIIKC